MEATTPIAGLLRWCILAPIYNQDNEFYSHLHLALLNNILEIPVTNPPKAICAQHLTMSIIPHILAQYNKFNKQENFKIDLVIVNNNLQIALDRFAQAIQVALSVNAIYGHLDDLFNQLQQLPYNKLLNIVIGVHNKQMK